MQYYHNFEGKKTIVFGHITLLVINLIMKEEVHNVTLSAKTSLMLEEHKAGFRREGQI